MKIALDLRPLQIGHQNRGIGAYLLNLLARLPAAEDVNYVILHYDTSDPVKDFRLSFPSAPEVVVVKRQVFSKHPIRLVLYGLSNLLPVYKKLNAHKPDVFFQVDYLLGAPKTRGCRVVTVAHDLIPLRFKQAYLPHWTKFYGFRQFKFKARVRLMLRAWFYEAKYKKGSKLLKRSDIVISVSENTKKDLIDLLGVPASRIQTIYSAASFRDTENQRHIRSEIKKRIDSISVPFISYIGGTDLRRQVDELVYAFNLYNARVAPLALVLAGNEFEKDSTEINPQAKRAIEDSSYAHNLHALGKVSEAEKKYILSKSAAFVYPTLYEGFGLPLLEALQCSTPVITYNNSAIPEIAGNSALYTKGVGSHPIFIALQELFNDYESWKKIAVQGSLRANDFTWEKCAAETWGLVIGNRAS